MLFRSWLLNREYEVFDARAVIGILISFSGAVLLAASLDTWPFVPAAWHDLLAWHWP